MVQQNQNSQSQDKTKSLVYMLSGVLFVLVLLEKSMGTKQNMNFPNPSLSDIPEVSALPHEKLKKPVERAKEKAKDSFLNESWAKGFAGFKNIGKDSGEIPVWEEPGSGIQPRANSMEGMSDEVWEDSVRSEIDEFLGEEEIPVLHSSGNASTQNEHVNLYFIKFFGSDHKAESRLVGVPRIIPANQDPILFILKELQSGPRPEESSKGVLNALPDNFSYSRDYKIHDGILYLDLKGSFEYGGGPEIIRDRMDQLAHSLVGVNGIRGIKLTIDRKKVSSLGGDGVPLPKVLPKRQRRVTTL